MTATLALALLGACTNSGSGGFGGTFIDRGVCDTLIECASQIAPDARDEYVATYGAGGTCWSMGGPSQWEFCRATCRDSLDALNLIGEVTGQTCGTCKTDADCGMGFCDEGLCSGGVGDEGETGEPGDEEAEDTDSSCSAPAACLRFVECMAAIAPEQYEEVEAQFGEDGSCWCGSEAEATECLLTCEEQLAAAMKQNPTVAQCHPSHCTLDELDPTQPYGPVDGGACPQWQGEPQHPFVNPFGLPGSFCAPRCSGVAMSCPDHSQTAAEGTCYISAGANDYCASRCWVTLPGTGEPQCQCGATCQPHGVPDGEGNQRGLCTFE